jgi:transcription initiation factor IIE alpha subunit
MVGEKRALPVDPKVEKRLLDFLEKHPGAYTDQIARRLKLDVFDVHDALMELYRRGKVKPGHAC